ncbi:ComEC/Rec2 family competence protein [Schlesneria paludicola]|uniref:ComEC/Rec2 family competence protein n=1 Tax=Schlesneria paludicola TaxID=360056 RepID=UPI00029B47C3|nr:ComEC/Rec2 family competence protein [Schlesneria paludicola]
MYEPTSDTVQTERPRRAPAIVLVGAGSTGILIDRIWNLSLDTWLILTTVFTIFWIVTLIWPWPSVRATEARETTPHIPSKRSSALIHNVRPAMQVGLILLGWSGLAGAWHHWRWSCLAADDIVNSATDERQLVRVEGRVAQTPWIAKRADGERADWQNPERTILLLNSRSLISGAAESMPVSGMVRVTIDGALAGVMVGDLIEVIGELSRPVEPANPGDFNQREFLRQMGVWTVIRSNHVNCVTVLDQRRTVWDWLLIARGAIRQRAEQLIAGRLGAETAPVAQAMLLGSRVQIDDETRRAFRESGMLHVLAISGMNVGLLWGWLWTLCRWLGRSAQTSTLLVLIALPVYALVTDANPPIVRATVVAVIVAFGQLIGRSGTFANALALAGLAVLLWNPCDLFNTGAQLSFLAVFAILHATNWMTLAQQQARDLTADAPLDSPVRRYIAPLGRAIVEANIVGLAVWLITSPLIASEFHLVSPIGSLLTVLLLIPVTFMFWTGYSFLLLGLIGASLFGWLGDLFDLCLRGFLWSVRLGASFEAGHLYVPAPPTWWTIGFYVCTVLPLFVASRREWGRAVSFRAGLAWLVCGLAWGVSRPPHPGLTCTFISVGHGLGVLMECPNGRTVLYDAGGMTGGASIARTISQTLWETGRSRLDAVVISHADGDHCNALPELSRIVSPHRLFVHRSFLDWNQPVVAAAIEQPASLGVQPQLISAGQSLVLDQGLILRVLHPSKQFVSLRDNPNSLVVCLEYAGRRILLTGDLELEGLDELLKTPPIDVDILLSPHHGSLKANPPDLARWARPEYVIVSTPESAVSARLAVQYGPSSQILTTATHGAIRCHVTPDGEIQVEPFKRKRGRNPH